MTGNARILRRQRDTRRHSLEQVKGGGSPRVMALEGDEIVMGRAAGARIHIGGKGASLRHALLRVRGTDCLVFDNNSRLGVFLNGVKIHSAVLRDGDVIQVADAVFVYSED
jgi:pSer/pThr/pTyr-binding forkhead associated (FHA) protein